MVTLLKSNQKVLQNLEGDMTFVWLNVVEPTPEDVSNLIEQYDLDPEQVQDSLDIDEQVRVEYERPNAFLIVRVPVASGNPETPYETVPVGIFVRENMLITLCVKNNEVMRSLSFDNPKNPAYDDPNSFILNLILRAATYYLRYLKDINRRTSKIEKDLKGSIKNEELISLLGIGKSLVYFTTSLKSNELLLEKLKKFSWFKLDEEGNDFLEDVIIENKQAIEMANIYNNILNSTMEFFASVISNNLSGVMKRLTSISIIIMVPTLVASIYGMNVKLPLAAHGWAFAVIIAGSVLLSVLTTFLLRRKHLL